MSYFIYMYNILIMSCLVCVSALHYVKKINHPNLKVQFVSDAPKQFFLF